MDRVMRALRGLSVMLALGATGCPDDDNESCEESEVTLVGPEGDPSLGVSKGRLSWLQTGDQSEFTLTATAKSSTATGCGNYYATEVRYQLESADGLVVGENSWTTQVDESGLIQRPELWFTLPAEPIIEAGKVPEAPGLAERSPEAELTLEPEADGSYTGSLLLTTSADWLHVAVCTVSKGDE